MTAKVGSVMSQVRETEPFVLSHFPKATQLKLGKLQLRLDPMHHNLFHLTFARASGCQDSQIWGLGNALHLPQGAPTSCLVSSTIPETEEKHLSDTPACVCFLLAFLFLIIRAIKNQG